MQVEWGRGYRARLPLSIKSGHNHVCTPPCLPSAPPTSMHQTSKRGSKTGCRSAATNPLPSPAKIRANTGNLAF